jgi:uncharacterized membrane protein YwzB
MTLDAFIKPIQQLVLALLQVLIDVGFHKHRTCSTGLDYCLSGYFLSYIDYSTFMAKI